MTKKNATTIPEVTIPDSVVPVTQIGEHTLATTLMELERAANGILSFAGKTIQSPVVVTILPNKGKQARCYGWFRGYKVFNKETNTLEPKADQFQWRTREGAGITEICINAEYLHRSTLEIITTVTHELAHLWAHDTGLRDVAGSGRHNKVFATVAEEFGLIPPETADKALGYSNATMGPTLEKFVASLNINETVFDLARQILPGKPVNQTNKMHKWQCTCGQHFRKAGEIDALCGKCGAPFKVQTPENED